MRGKSWLKRLFLGRLVPMPAELSPGFAPIDEPCAAPIAAAPSFRVIYAVARP